ncbi:MAG: protein kinase [Proteobacteria bacterium]|nr:protein kinase [Pseudomonadota bacterium]
MDNSENTLQPAENPTPSNAATKKHPFIHGSSQSDSREILKSENAGDTQAKPLPLPIKSENPSQSITSHKRTNSANNPLPINLPAAELDIFLDLNLEDSKSEAIPSDILDCVPDVGDFDPLSSDFDVASLLTALNEDNNPLPVKATDTESKANTFQKDSALPLKDDTDKKAEKKNNFQIFKAPNIFQSVVPQKDSGKKTKEDADKKAEKKDRIQAFKAPDSGDKTITSQKKSDDAPKKDADKKDNLQTFKAPDSGDKTGTPQKKSVEAPKEDAETIDKFRAFRTKPEFKSNPPQKDADKAPTEDTDDKDKPQSAEMFLAIEVSDEDVETSSEFSVSAGILAIGAVVQQRYKIIDVIGEGGFATVYHAHDIKEDRDIALKVMDPKKGIDTTYTERFFREAKIASKIHHDNVVSIYDFDRIEETGQPYIAMELLKGHALNDEITDNGPLTPKRAFSLFRPVLDALATGHRLGIIHKDLKPENLYLVSPGTPHETLKILDFGVARVQSEATRLTSDGLIFGTPRYLAPEYIRSQLVSPAVDVYQMALIFSEVLTGVPAVSGEPYQVMMLHCSGDIQIADYLLEGAVGKVFRKALSIHPEDRYPDCDAFGKAFDSIAEFFTSDEVLDDQRLLTRSPKPKASVQLLNSSSKASDEPKEKAAADSTPKDDASKKEETDKPEDAKKSKDSDNSKESKDSEDVKKSKDSEDAKKSEDSEDAKKSEDSEDAKKSKNSEDAKKSKDSANSKESEKSKQKDKSESKPSYLYAGLVVILVILIIGISFASRKEAPPTQEVPPQAAVQSNRIIEFSFTTVPSGARVIRSGAFPVCSPTPCKAQFQESDLNLTQLIDFELDGYKVAHYELKKTSYEETKGQINIVLSEEERVSKVDFTLNYEPMNAIVTETETGMTVCTASPCSYTFELDLGYVELKIEADGYQEKIEKLSKRRYDETHGQLYVTLDKGGKRDRRKSGASADVDELCQQAVKAKVNGNKCEAYKLYRKAKSIGITDGPCRRNADYTIAAYAAECNK